MKKLYIPILLGALFFNACKSKVDVKDANPGAADFSNYVAIGNSLTAGYADNSLYKSGQENSYPNILAKQFTYVGSGDFLQPLLPGETGWPSRKLVLGYDTDCKSVTSIAPIPYPEAQDTLGSSASIGHLNYGNLGVPGIKLAHIAIRGYGLLNPYAGRFFKNPSLQSPIDVYLNNMPTFFSIWLGSNDVLGYATSGGNGTVGGNGLNDITDPVNFQFLYDSLVSQLTRYGAKGVLINIPDVSSTPFFNTIDPKGLNLSIYQAQQMTDAYNALGLSHIQFKEGANYFIVEDDSLVARAMKPGELLLLSIPTDSLKCGGWGSVKPIPKRYVLDQQELANIKTATEGFNAIIGAIASKYDLALMDVNQYMKTIASGITWNGVNYNLSFVSGGLFSLDGIHLTPRGNALVANEIIKVINTKYGATIPQVNGNAYPGVKMP